MKKKFLNLLIIIVLLPCVMLLGACSNQNVYVTAISKNDKGGYTVTYSNGKTTEIKNVITQVDFTIDDLKEEWQQDHEAGETFSDYLIKNANIVASYNIGVEELKSAWQTDYDEGKTTKTFSEFLASFANLGEGYDLTSSINNALFNSVSIVATFTYTTNYNPWTGTGGEEETTQGAGSGIIYSLDKVNKVAYIITNYHVVYDGEYSKSVSNNIKVCVYGSENFRDNSSTSISATFVGGSEYYDIAVLKVTEGSKNSAALFNHDLVKPANLENSNNVFVGEEIFAIGNAQGYGLSAVQGIVSVDSEDILMNEVTQETSREIRITAPVNPGNSGGGLFNSKGKLIGIVNAKIVDESVEGIGYAIPMNVARAVAENIIKTCDGTSLTSGKFVRVGLTIGIKSSKAVIDEATGFAKVEEEVYVLGIGENSLASKSNLQIGDIIHTVKVKRTAQSEVQQLDVTRMHILTDAVLSCFAGGSIELFVTHTGGNSETITIIFTENCLQTIA